VSRFYLPPSSIQGTTFVLSGPEAHHAVHVLRKKVGDQIDLFDGQDAAYTGRIDQLDPQEIRGTLLQQVSAKALPVQVTLYQSLSRGSKWEWLLEKACEVGVSTVVPVFTRRTLIKLDAAQAEEKVERWNRIALAASKQCGRSDLMKVETPREFSTAITTLHKDQLALIPWEKEDSRSIAEACRSYKGKQVNLFIGPEGGWDPAEIELALSAQVIPVRLGPTLLRTETAGMIASALVLREFGVY
jgi:16S rRNA (uracil1498-N3)-methyltransferase